MKTGTVPVSAFSSEDALEGTVPVQKEVKEMKRDGTIQILLTVPKKMYYKTRPTVKHPQTEIEIKVKPDLIAAILRSKDRSLYYFKDTAKVKAEYPD